MYTASTSTTLIAFCRACSVLVLPDVLIPSIHSRAAAMFWGVVGTKWSLHSVTSLLNWMRLKEVLCTICSRSNWRSFLLIRLKRPSRELDVSTTITIYKYRQSVNKGVYDTLTLSSSTVPNNSLLSFFNHSPLYIWIIHTVLARLTSLCTSEWGTELCFDSSDRFSRPSEHELFRRSSTCKRY